jgi:putative transposase
MAETLVQWIGCQRVIKNAKHDELSYLLWLRKRAILSPSWQDPDPQGEGFPLDQTYSQFKTGLTPWLSEVPSQVLRNGVVLYQRAWSNHWRNPAHFRRPRRKRKWAGNSIWLTRELFRFLGPGRVELGTAAHPIGVLSFVPHREIPEPASITLTRTRYDHWFLSYASDRLEGPELRPDGERLEALAGDPDLDAKVLGIDRGVRILAACSDGTAHGMKESLRARIQVLERRKRHYQRGVARKPEGTRRREKAQAKVSRNSARVRNIREDFLKKTAHAIAQAAPEVTALEWLNLKGMTRKAKPKRDERTGTWLRNGATCKTALNRALANAGMGKLDLYLEQALRRLGKLLVRVPAAHSSQECSACAATDPGNRTDQETFLCKRCGHAENADHNAARVIRKRGIALILTAGTAGRARTGSTRSDRLDGRGEVRRNKGGTPSAAPVKRETPSF